MCDSKDLYSPVRAVLAASSALLSRMSRNPQGALPDKELAEAGVSVGRRFCSPGQHGSRSADVPRPRGVEGFHGSHRSRCTAEQRVCHTRGTTLRAARSKTPAPLCGL